MRRIFSAAIMLAMLTAGLGPTTAFAATPPNDNFANATTVPGFPFTNTVDLSQATAEAGEPSDCAFFSGSASAWYTLTASSTGSVSVTPDRIANPGTFLGAYHSAAPGFAGLSLLGCAQFSNPLSFNVASGSTYYVQVTQFGGGSSHRLTFTFAPPPPNDEFDAATTVGSLPFAVVENTSSSSSAADDPTSSCGGQGPTVWYDFTPAQAAVVDVNTEGSSYDTLIGAYTGARGGLSEVACNNNDPRQGSYQARLRIAVQASVTYHLMIGWGAGVYPTAGELHLSVALAPPPPANDDFNDATAIGALPFGQDLDTSAATVAADDPSGSCFGPVGATVWYKITPTTSDPIRIAIRALDFGPAMALYTGSRGNLVEVGCAAYSTVPEIRLDPTVGTTYYLMVGDFTPLGGGHLRVDVSLAFALKLSIDSGRVAPPTGVATISGTITCTKPGYISTTNGQLTQKVGRYTVNGPLYVYAYCPGTLPWSATVVGDSGPFVAGKAEASLALFGYDGDTGEFDQVSTNATVILKGGGH
jgi:hypothetical protein